MSATIPTLPPLPLFITLGKFQDYGLPGRTRAYDMAKLGLLDLRKDAAGRVGVTGAEALRFVTAAQPIAECKRDLSKATNSPKRHRRIAS